MRKKAFNRLRHRLQAHHRKELARVAAMFRLAHAGNLSNAWIKRIYETTNRPNLRQAQVLMEWLESLYRIEGATK